MNRHEHLNQLETAIGVAAGVVITDQISHLVAEWIKLPGITTTLLIIVIAVCIVLSQYFIGYLFRKSWALRQLLLGNQFIEGTWFDTMRVNGEVAEIGFSRIKYTDKDINYGGEDYNMSMDKCFDFDSEIVKMKWPELHYVYKAYRSDEKEEATKGYGVLRFEQKHSGAPTKYSGKYYILRGTGTIGFEGIRLDKKRDKVLIEMLDKETTRKEALKRLNEIYNS